jgi:hypothetical protein
MDGGDVGILAFYRLAPSVTGVGFVPVLHGPLAEAPAKKYTPPPTLAREINEPGIEWEPVLDPQIANLADAAVNLRSDLLRLAFELHGPRVRVVYRSASGPDLDLAHAIAPPRVERDNVAHDAADQWKRAIRLLYGVRRPHDIGMLFTPR